MNKENKGDSYFNNWLSVIGGIFSVIMFAVNLFLIIQDFLAKEGNPYLGVITYFLAPALLTLSLALTVFGAIRERSSRLKRGHVRRFPQIDFNNPTHQKIAFTTIGVGTLFFLFTIVGLYRSYEFTESTAFCGLLCHKVMSPEYTAYHHSPHANVTCVQCHIGPGAEWYVRSKFSGAYQVYSVFANRFSKPIKTPIKHLRPAQETCEHCHWPRQFYGAVEQDHQYFLPDEQNSEWKTRMLMFVGGGIPPYGKKEGIHWHMNIKSKVFYIATDEKRQVIPWVKVIGQDGKEKIYVDKESGFSADNPPPGEMRRMDCMDCHNRPSHAFKSPSAAVNEAIGYGAIDKTLPFIKREAVKALVAEHPSHDEAQVKIREHLEAFYKTEYPQVWDKDKKNISEAVEATVNIYKTNFFPQMNVAWKVYPNNIGHFIFPGCFRCHDNKHETPDGSALTNKCTVCHNIIEQGPPDAAETNAAGLEFKHPDQDVGDAWKEMSCTECHTGESA